MPRPSTLPWPTSPPDRAASATEPGAAGGLRTRVASAAVLVPVVVVLWWIGLPWFGLGVLGVIVVAAAEAVTLLRRAGHGGPAWLAAIVAILYAGLLACLPLLMARAADLPGTAPLAAWLDGGRAWVLATVLVVWAFDSGAYLVGRRFGRRRLAPRISPGKTVEGVVGGVAAALVASLAVLLPAGQSLAAALLFGPVVGLVGQAGDLAESALKRAAGAKDSGALIPGHGGMLDRVDSLLLAGPAACAWLLVLGGLR